MELGYAIAMLMEAPPAADDDGGNCCNCFFMAAVEVVAVNLPAPKRLPCRPQARGGALATQLGCDCKAKHKYKQC